MSGPLTEVQIAGMQLRVPAFDSREATQALVESVHAKLKDLESRSLKVNTQAFALQAAYEFALEAAETKRAYAEAEARLVTSIQGLHQRMEALRSQIEDSGGASTAR